ncbi:Com family DNA-binding transcriptional regulator [Pseudomonas syringae]|uniref:Com family DNA-binding transcriptional regulator n=1 Tax=Pseudomonas syringae TaxID=317 RepID=UPI001376AB32|nr:Com family DNA-binding transcriptional regulator [Pseudomonas syringae]
MYILKDFRCGQCWKLLTRMGDHTELQIKSSRCGALSRVKAASHESSPLRLHKKAESSANIN